VDCFREGPNFLTIDPDECIDCAVCIPECPVNAIYAEEDVPADQQHMTQLNAELARLPTWKSITKRKDPLPDADEWKDKTDKLSERADPLLTPFSAAAQWNHGTSVLNQEVINTALAHDGTPVRNTDGPSKPMPSSSAQARSACSRCSNSACWKSRPM
jgi:ferredoxin